ncbi:MAG: MltA domain-containing protein [Bdellovibrionales bacterium]|nr:MltA domain-containing protein [Bdellovibrionales bacterium]
MKRILLLILLLVSSNAFATTPPRSLIQITSAHVPGQILQDEGLWKEREKVLKGIVHTLNYLKSNAAKEDYSSFSKTGLDLETVEFSLRRFYQLLITSKNYDEFVTRVTEEFSLYQSIGHDGKGSIKFTGYFQPIYKASLVKTSEYKYPLFSKPEDFDSWSLPHPTRVALEGIDGLGQGNALLKGKELAFLRNRYEAFMVHVQGSAILELPHGKRMAVGFAAGTQHPFRGVSGSFLREHNVAWNKLGDFFQTRTALLDDVLSKNNRFIFFEKKPLPDALGSLGVPVIAERSIATDNVKLPPGAIGIIKTKLPSHDTGNLKEHSRIVLNLDTGSAIKGPGRVDVFMGTGKEAYRKASSVFGYGKLYYLFVKNGDQKIVQS